MLLQISKENKKILDSYKSIKCSEIEIGKIFINGY